MTWLAGGRVEHVTVRATGRQAQIIQHCAEFRRLTPAQAGKLDALIADLRNGLQRPEAILPRQVPNRIQL